MLRFQLPRRFAPKSPLYFLGTFSVSSVRKGPVQNNSSLIVETKRFESMETPSMKLKSHAESTNELPFTNANGKKGSTKRKKNDKRKDETASVQSIDYQSANPPLHDSKEEKATTETTKVSSWNASNPSHHASSTSDLTVSASPYASPVSFFAKKKSMDVGLPSSSSSTQQTGISISTSFKHNTAASNVSRTSVETSERRLKLLSLPDLEYEGGATERIFSDQKRISCLSHVLSKDIILRTLDFDGSYTYLNPLSIAEKEEVLAHLRRVRNIPVLGVEGGSKDGHRLGKDNLPYHHWLEEEIQSVLNHPQVVADVSLPMMIGGNKSKETKRMNLKVTDYELLSATPFSSVSLKKEDAPTLQVEGEEGEEEHGYSFTVWKENTGSAHLQREISSRFNIPLDDIKIQTNLIKQCCGAQKFYIIVNSSKKNNPNGKRKVHAHVTRGLILSLNYMAFPHFTLRVSNVEKCTSSQWDKLGLLRDAYGCAQSFVGIFRDVKATQAEISEQLSNLKEIGYLNYLVPSSQYARCALHVLRGEFRKAIFVRLYERSMPPELADFLRHPSPAAARRARRNVVNSEGRSVLKAYLNDRGNPVSMLLCLHSRHIWRVHLQEFMWNLMASRRIRAHGHWRPVVGDCVVVRREGEATTDEKGGSRIHQPVRRNEICILESEEEARNYTIYDVVMPYPDERFTALDFPTCAGCRYDELKAMFMQKWNFAPFFDTTRGEDMERNKSFLYPKKGDTGKKVRAIYRRILCKAPELNWRTEVHTRGFLNSRWKRGQEARSSSAQLLASDRLLIQRGLDPRAAAEGPPQQEHPHVDHETEEVMLSVQPSSSSSTTTFHHGVVTGEEGTNGGKGVDPYLTIDPRLPKGHFVETTPVSNIEDVASICNVIIAARVPPRTAFSTILREAFILQSVQSREDLQLRRYLNDAFLQADHDWKQNYHKSIHQSVSTTSSVFDEDKGLRHCCPCCFFKDHTSLEQCPLYQYRQMRKTEREVAAAMERENLIGAQRDKYYAIPADERPPQLVAASEEGKVERLTVSQQPRSTDLEGKKEKDASWEQRIPLPPNPSSLHDNGVSNGDLASAQQHQEASRVEAISPTHKSTPALVQPQKEESNTDLLTIHIRRSNPSAPMGVELDRQLRLVGIRIDMDFCHAIDAYYLHRQKSMAPWRAKLFNSSIRELKKATLTKEEGKIEEEEGKENLGSKDRSRNGPSMVFRLVTINLKHVYSLQQVQQLFNNPKSRRGEAIQVCLQATWHRENKSAAKDQNFNLTVKRSNPDRKWGIELNEDLSILCIEPMSPFAYYISNLGCAIATRKASEKTKQVFAALTKLLERGGGRERKNDAEEGIFRVVVTELYGTRVETRQDAITVLQEMAQKDEGKQSLPMGIQLRGKHP